MNTSTRTFFRRLRVLAIIAVFLVPAGYGFMTKFRELLLLTVDEDGAFAVMPVVTYLTATLGFFFLLIYAAMNGMFRNIEQPKLAMLETERRLDAEMREGDAPDNFVGGMQI